ncbi:hypothetical protein B0H63DRAFT_513594 [Podospora didyma]|uniref:Uncharacterized protein n=1 Tax=Podospora didyma TaxID=330526 RepID=A0AAE0N6I2_9PEZI|nr:hypothetical protein B0H63DRAFT_513594 [Podospora didyma]
MGGKWDEAAAAQEELPLSLLNLQADEDAKQETTMYGHCRRSPEAAKKTRPVGGANKMILGRAVARQLVIKRNSLMARPVDGLGVGLLQASFQDSRLQVIVASTRRERHPTAYDSKLTMMLSIGCETIENDIHQFRRGTTKHITFKPDCLSPRLQSSRMLSWFARYGLCLQDHPSQTTTLGPVQDIGRPLVELDACNGIKSLNYDLTICGPDLSPIARPYLECASCFCGLVPSPLHLQAESPAHLYEEYEMFTYAEEYEMFSYSEMHGTPKSSTGDNRGWAISSNDPVSRQRGGPHTRGGDVRFCLGTSMRVLRSVTCGLSPQPQLQPSPNIPQRPQLCPSNWSQMDST